MSARCLLHSIRLQAAPLYLRTSRPMWLIRPPCRLTRAPCKRTPPLPEHTNGCVDSSSEG